MKTAYATGCITTPFIDLDDDEVASVCLCGKVGKGKLAPPWSCAEDLLSALKAARKWIEMEMPESDPRDVFSWECVMTLVNNAIKKAEVMK